MSKTHSVSGCADRLDLFNAILDRYNGLTIKTDNLKLSDDEFETNLTASLPDWMKSGIRGVWFKVNIKNSSFIPILVKHGFHFHHAKTSYVMLTRWLPGDEPNLLPQYPFTHIGVGGLVINENKEILTIQEKFHKKKHWKLPGGYSNPGEDIIDTAKREVFEETGVETEFVSVVAFRQYHQHIFNCSDFYFVCHLKPVTQTITKSNDEISDCMWMDVETYRNHIQVTEFNRFIINSYLENMHFNKNIVATPILSFNKDSYHKVYHIQGVSPADTNS